MARIFAPLNPPNDPEKCPPWLNRMLRQLSDSLMQGQRGLAAVARGESPDGAGTPLFTLDSYFYKPGIVGGQRAYGGTYAGDELVLSSTSHTTKGPIYFGASMTQAVFDEALGYFGIGTVAPAALLHVFSSGAVMARFEPPTFTVANCTVTNGSPTVTTSDSFAPTGGPRVVPGMYVTGTGIPANTQVKHLNSGTSMVLTNSATTGPTVVTLTFQTYVQFALVSDESGRDVSWSTAGAIRFTPGTTGVPFRFDGDTLPIVSGAADTARVYVEAGYISSGSAVGSDLQIGGPGHGELSRLYLSARTIWITRNTASGTDVHVGIVTNPAEFTGGFGPDSTFIMTKASTAGMTLIGASGSNPILEVLPNGSITGSSPNKALDRTSFIFKVTEDARVYVGNAAGSSFYLSAPSGQFFVSMSTGENLLAVAANGAGWSDSQTSAYLYIGDTTGSAALRVLITSDGGGLMNRFGVSSKYTLFANAQAANADFEAPAANPQVVHIINSSSSDGNNASILLEIEGKRSGQTADLLSISSVVSGSVPFSVTNKAQLLASVPYAAKTTTYPITNSDGIIDCTSGSFTVTLPTAVGIDGRVFIIKNSGAGTITLATTSSQTIDGAAPGTLAAGVTIRVASTGANWITV